MMRSSRRLFVCQRNILYIQLDLHPWGEKLLLTKDLIEGVVKMEPPKNSIEYYGMQVILVNFSEADYWIYQEVWNKAKEDV